MVLRRAAATARRGATEDEAKALASPLRLRILRVCLAEPHSNKEIAAALGKDPATVLHHVRKLVDTGFLAPQEVRRGTRGSREIPYLATGKSWAISTPGQGQVLVETFLDEVAAVPAQDLETARLGLRLSPDDLDRFQSRLQEVFDEFAALPHSPDGAAWSVFFAMHPDPNRS